MILFNPLPKQLTKQTNISVILGTLSFELLILVGINIKFVSEQILD